MRIAVFQFGSNENIINNFNAIKRAATQAYENKIRLLVFHECAICGYPPIETDINKINFDLLNDYIKEIEQLAKKYDMYIAVGTIRRIESKNYNSITLINPHGETVGNYDKRALLGWDLDNFVNGNSLGIYEIDNIKIGFRICSETRFPECFRELFRAKAELCFVCFSDVSDNDWIDRYEVIKSALGTRAAENVITVVSVNSISKYQTAPTAVFDINGVMIKEAPKNAEHLLVYDYDTPEIIYEARNAIQNRVDELNL
jgi:predicted amidohydrolase